MVKYLVDNLAQDLIILLKSNVQEQIKLYDSSQFNNAQFKIYCNNQIYLMTWDLTNQVYSELSRDTMAGPGLSQEVEAIRNIMMGNAQYALN